MRKKEILRYKNVDGINWHLRRENDGGVLIVNGGKIIELNKSAFNYVRAFMKKNCSDKKTIWYMFFRHGVFPTKAKKDWLELKESLLTASKGCCEGAGIKLQVEKKEYEAPIRVDLALTYRCNNDCFHCYAGGNHKTDELSTEQWKKAIDKLWQFGVPQVVFTGGESLIRDDLEDLIHYANSKGMITGLITNGRLLKEERVKRLESNGLDFVQITIESHIEDVHDNMVMNKGAFKETLMGIKVALNSQLRVTTNTTMTLLNAKTIIDTVEFLLGLGVKNIGLNGLIRSKRGKDKEGLNANQLREVLQEVQILTEKNSAELIWFTPTCYLAFNPLKERLGTKRCSAASTVLAIEPTGRIIPCQSYFEGLGNVDIDTLEDAWNHPLAVSLRERKWLDEICNSCVHVLACGGSCPLEYEERSVW